MPSVTAKNIFRPPLSISSHLNGEIRAVRKRLTRNQSSCRICFWDNRFTCLVDVYANIKNPSEASRRTLAAKLNISERVIQNWFKSRRLKEKRHKVLGIASTSAPVIQAAATNTASYMPPSIGPRICLHTTLNAEHSSDATTSINQEIFMGFNKRTPNGCRCTAVPTKAQLKFYETNNCPTAASEVPPSIGPMNCLQTLPNAEHSSNATPINQKIFRDFEEQTANGLCCTTVPTKAQLKFYVPSNCLTGARSTAIAREATTKLCSPSMSKISQMIHDLSIIDD